MDKVNILGVNVDMVTIDEAADIITKKLGTDETFCVLTPNSEIIMKAYEDEEFCRLLNSANLLTADGIGVVYASRMLRKPIKERAAGFDIAQKVLEYVATSGHGLFLFGGKPGVAELAADNLRSKYPDINICGMRNGYFKDEESPEIVNAINESGASLVFVCLGAPKQEHWINVNKNELKSKVLMGIGGSLDVIAGTAERAPEWWQKHGLEWLYRLKKEPWRFMRMTALPRFAFTVMLHGRKYPQNSKGK